MPETSRLRRGKVLGLGFCADRMFADQQSLPGDLVIEILVLWRIDVVDATGQHRDGAVSRLP